MSKFFYSLVALLLLNTMWVQAQNLSSHLQFSARLSGDQEVPAVTTDAQGVAVFTLDESKRSLYVQVSLSNLSSPITGMHIHEGNVGENGGVVFNLGTFLTGNRAKGIVSGITPDVIARLLNGGYYINVHTEDNPSGEIRGQIGLETDYRYTAFMEGSQEVPEVTTDGYGLGIFHLNHSQTSVNFKVLFQGLTSNVTGAHIHNAPSGSNGGVIFDFGPFLNGNRIEGIWEPGPNLAALLAGELYINVHTENNPGGEIRGQIILLPGITFDLQLTGGQENPAVVTPADGLGIVTIFPTLDEIAYYVVYDSLSGPAAASHFHRGDPGMNGGVVVDISDGINDEVNIITGTKPLTLALFNDLLEGDLYINIHTAANPGGEIRGQVYRFAREGFVFEMNGGQEVPAVTTAGVGAGLVSIDRDWTNAHYMAVVSSLAGTFSASHFHNAAPGVNGGVIFNITSSFNDFGGAYGYWEQTSTPPFDPIPFQNREVYINVHNDLHGGGEIRGNIVQSSSLFGELPFDPGFSNDLILSGIMTGDQEVPAVATDARGLATVFFDADKSKAEVNITASGLSGPITGVHIHEADPGTSGPVLFPLTNEGNRIQTVIENITPLELISLMNAGTYANIHTAENPSGEIRGQLYLEQDFTFLASMSGSEEVPEVTTDGLGLAAIHWTRGTLTVSINAQFTGLSSSIIGVHIHEAPSGENGPVVVDLGPYLSGNTLNGTFDIDFGVLTAIREGNAYINVHTENHPAGEIRGQLTELPGVTFDGWMSGNQEVPFTTTNGSGLAVVTIFPGITDIALWMLADGLTGPIGAAHLHNAPLQTNGGVVHDLSDDIVGNSILHLGVVEESIVSAMLTGGIYINAHTAAYPGGEIRGQLFRRARDGYGFDLCSEQEVGTVNAPGSSGSALASIDRNYSNLNIYAVVDGLTGDVTASHIHEAPVGVNGGVIYDLTPYFSDNLMVLVGGEVDTAVINAIRSGNTYVNVHTALHGGGEIRGQIVKEFLCSIEVGVDQLEDIVSEIQLSPVPVNDVLNVTMDVQTDTRLSFQIADVTGKIISRNDYDLVQGENTISVATDALTDGFYLLVITDGKRVSAAKFIK